MQFVEFSKAVFYAPGQKITQSLRQSSLLELLVYRPTIFQRNEVRWIAAHSWRSRTKAAGVAALKEAKQEAGPRLVADAAGSLALLIRELLGGGAAQAVTGIPCGHSRRGDCFGKRLAQSVAEALELPFVQVFADRPRAAVSHSKQSASLAPLQQIAEPPRAMIVIDDLATSGRHLEELVLALRRLGVAASALAWISGSSTGGKPLSGGVDRLLPEVDPA